MSGAAEYDLFACYAGPDREEVQELRSALQKAGLRVFLDRIDIDSFESITDEIEAALHSSKALLAYYSRSFSSRPACQLELTAAFLAGQREGDSMRRIVVVNPEEPESAHLLPTELADMRYALRPRDSRSRREVVADIAVRVRRLDGTIADARLTDHHPRSYGRPAGVPGFVGRYPEQWALHSALAGVDRTMTQEPTSEPFVALIGMPGIGKTSVAAAYAWNFGAAYQDGVVCWISLRDAGPSPRQVLDRYESEVRTAAETLGLEVAGLSVAQVRGQVADHLDGRPGPSLWVVDDVPDGLDPTVVQRLILPAGTKLRTILISRTDRHESIARDSVVLGPLAEADAQELLRRFREPAEDEEVPFEHVVKQLHGHPMAVRLGGLALRDRQGLVSFAQFEDRLAAEPDILAAVADLLRDQIVALGPAPRLILQLALAGDHAAPLTVRLVATVVGRLLPATAGQEVTGDALAGFAGGALATRSGTDWQLHSLVLDAARRHLTPAVPGPELALSAAGSVEELAADPALSPVDRGNLMRHAARLAASPDLPPALAETLLRRVVSHYEGRGEPILAAPSQDFLAALRPHDAGTLATAASIWSQAGEHATAEERAKDALVLAARASDRPASYRARRALAEALDAQSRYDEAENHWTVLTRANSVDFTDLVGPVDALAARVARLRSLRLRGRLTELKELAARLLENDAAGVVTSGSGGADNAAVQDLGQAAALELARAEVLTDGQRLARELSEGVVEHYRRRGLPGHALALEAQEVLAEAWLTLHLWEMWPDAKDWVRAEGELRRLRERYRRSHGENNYFTLAASVDLVYALVSQGERDEGGKELRLLLPKLQGQLGDRNPLFLRAVFLSGLILAQCQQHEQATPLFERALRGQRAVLGPGHAHALRTQYELAVMYKLAGDRRWRPLMKEVNRLAPAAVGRETDLYAQSVLALALLRLPTKLVRAVARAGRPRGKK